MPKPTLEEPDRAGILLSLRRMHEAGEPLSPAYVIVRRPNLAAAVWGAFKSLFHATRAGGLPYIPMRQQDRSLLLKELRRLHRLGADLSPISVQRQRQPFHLLLVKCFGSYEKAVTEAGLDYSALCQARTWDRERVLARLRELRGAGVHLSSGVLSREDPGLRVACNRHFGSMEAARRALGIDHMERIPIKWNRQLVIEHLRRRHAAGKKLNPATVLREDSPLYFAGDTHFGTYRKAVEAAGFDYRHIIGRLRRHWNREAVLAALRQRLHSNLPMHARAVQRHDHGLYAVAVTYCGSYPAALEAIGLDYEQIRRTRPRASAGDCVANATSSEAGAAAPAVSG